MEARVDILDLGRIALAVDQEDTSHDYWEIIKKARV